MGRHPSRRHASAEDAPIGRRIRARRRELGLTQADLAAPEYTKSFISQIESGVADPSLDSLRFLSRRLQSSLSLIAGDSADQRVAAVEGLLQWGREAAWAREVPLVRRVLDTAVEMAAAVELGGLRTDALLLLAEFEAARGEADRAERILTQIGERSESTGPRTAVCVSLIAGTLALRRRDHAAAGSWFRDGLGRLGTGVRHPDLTARALLGLAAVLRATGDLGHARRRAEAAARLAARAQHPVLSGKADVLLGRIALAQGLPEEAARLLRSAWAVLDAAKDLRAQADARIHLARAALAAGGLDEALQSSRAALALATTLADEGTAARASGAEGRALLRVGDPQAAAQLQRAAADLERTGEVEDLAEAATDLADHHRSRGEHGPAERYDAIAQQAARGPGGTRQASSTRLTSTLPT